MDRLQLTYEKIDKDKPKEVTTHIKLSRHWEQQLYISWQ